MFGIRQVRSVRFGGAPQVVEELDVEGVAGSREADCGVEGTDGLPCLGRGVRRLFGLRGFHVAEGDEHVAPLRVVDVLDQGFAVVREGG